MADVIDNAEFWLPSHFLAEDPMRMEDSDSLRNGLAPGKLFFPPEFPYGFDSTVGSTEAENDEEELLAELTRRLARSALNETQKRAAAEKTWVLTGSPESTLSALRSWSGSPNAPSGKSSPLVTPPSCNRDPWEVLYAAAGHVARMKAGCEGPKKFSQHYPQSRAPFGCSGDPSSPQVKNSALHGHYCNQIPTHSASQTNQFQKLMRQGHEMEQEKWMWGRQAEEEMLLQQVQLQQQRILNRGRCSVVGHENERCGPPLGLPQSARPPLQLEPPQNHHGCGMRATFLGGGDGGGESSGKRRESTGTGVFLPRRYGNPPESRKKQGCSTVLLPARVVQALNLNQEASAPAQRRFTNSGSLVDYEAFVARRNALLIEQQKRSMRQELVRNSELRLPQEWTY